MPNPETSNVNLYDGNLLFYKNGLLGSTPHDLMQALADEYEGTHLVSAVQIRGALFERDGYASTNGIKCAIAEQTFSLLNQGEDVALDALYNSPKTRESIQTVASAAGAATVALQIHTPRGLAIKRVDSWVEETEYSISPKAWSKKDRPQRVVRSMKGMSSAGTAVQPGEADYILKVNGAASTDNILEQINDQLVKHGLADS